MSIWRSSWPPSHNVKNSGKLIEFRLGVRSPGGDSTSSVKPLTQTLFDRSSDVPLTRGDRNDEREDRCALEAPHKRDVNLACQFLWLLFKESIFRRYIFVHHLAHVFFFLRNSARDSQSLHLGKECGSFQSQFDRCAAWPTDDPSGLLKRFHNQRTI